MANLIFRTEITGGNTSLAPAANCIGAAFHRPTRMMYTGPRLATPGMFARVNVDTFTLDATCAIPTPFANMNQQQTFVVQGLVVSLPGAFVTGGAGPSPVYTVPTGAGFLPANVQSLDLTTTPGGFINTTTQYFGACSDGRYVYMGLANNTPPSAGMVRVDPLNLTPSGVTVLDLTNTALVPGAVSCANLYHDPRMRRVFCTLLNSSSTLYSLASIDPANFNLANVVVGPPVNFNTNFGGMGAFILGRSYLWFILAIANPLRMWIPYDKRGCSPIGWNTTQQNTGTPANVKTYSDNRRYLYAYWQNWRIQILDEANPGIEQNISITGTMDPTFNSDLSGNLDEDDASRLYMMRTGATPNMMRMNMLKERMFAGEAGR